MLTADAADDVMVWRSNWPTLHAVLDRVRRTYHLAIASVGGSKAHRGN
jgi:hypothetical protein